MADSYEGDGVKLSDEIIPAKCPVCGGSGVTGGEDMVSMQPPVNCAKCGGAGTVAMSFAKGFLFTQHCNSCGQDNGGSIRETDEVEGKQVVYGNSMGQPVGPPDDTPVGCVWCRSEDVVWQLCGRTDE